MTTRIAINGLGRIGRATLRAVLEEPALELVAVNDIAPADNLAYLVRHDSVYGRSPREVRSDDSSLVIGDASIASFAEEDPARLPWGDLGVELVFECTGVFDNGDDMRKHIDAGARRVVLSAPAKDDTPTTVYGVDHDQHLDDELVSAASCTTNCTAPVMEVLTRHLGVAKAMMTTAHAYTISQELVDAPAKKWSRGRAAAANIVPTTTGAAKATALVVPALEGIFDGVALRVPVAAGSISDIVCVTERSTSVEEVNQIFRDEAAGDRYRDVLGVSEDPLVSSDVIADPRASLVDLNMTQVIGGDLVKVMSWYDNEYGYAVQMVRLATAMVAQPAEAQTASV